MPATVAYFDSLFAAVDPVLDAVYAKLFQYRAGGLVFDITASLRAHDVEADPEKDIYDTWHGHAFELRAAELLAGGVPVPQAGHEIAEPTATGFQVYQVMSPPKKRCYDPIDAEEVKLLVYTKKVRTE